MHELSRFSLLYAIHLLMSLEVLLDQDLSLFSWRRNVGETRGTLTVDLIRWGQIAVYKATEVVVTFDCLDLTTCCI